MNIYTLRSSMAISVAALAFGACSDCMSESAPDDSAARPVVSRMRLSVGDGVTIGPAVEKTRGTNLDFQNGTFAAGTEIGIFILKENAYGDFLAASDRPYGNGGRTDVPVPDMGGEGAGEETAGSDVDRNAILIADAYRDGITYGYENVKASISADGTITRADGLDFIYPLHRADRVAIMAYAPYDENITYTELKSGFPVVVNHEQVGDAAMQQSDLLFGTPSAGNPVSRGDGIGDGTGEGVGEATDGWNAIEASRPVSLTFRHSMSGIRLHAKIANTAEFRSDSIILTMGNVALADTLLPLLTAEADEGVFFGSPVAEPSSVTMVRLAGITESDADTVMLSCNALIPPQTVNDGRRVLFGFTFKGRAGGLPDTTIVRTDSRAEVVYRPGKQSIYRACLPGVPSDENETLPDEGKDDIILGAPKPR